MGLEGILQRLWEGGGQGAADSAWTLPTLAWPWESGNQGSNLSFTFWGM